MDGAAFRAAGLSFLNPNRERLADSLHELAANPHYEWMQSWFAGLTVALEEPGLDREHARLFGSEPVCPPWQSTTAQSNGSAIRDDHVGMLLISFAMLLERNAPPLDLLRFWTDHLEWVPEFCRAVEHRARHPYFKLLAAWIRDALLMPAMSEPPARRRVEADFQRVGVS